MKLTDFSTPLNELTATEAKIRRELDSGATLAGVLKKYGHV